jgi:transcriptional regulator with XRE-family HTH domain
MKRALKQSDLAKKIGVSNSTISKMEGGEDAIMPSVETLAAICDATDTSADYFLGLSDSPLLSKAGAHVYELPALPDWLQDILADLITFDSGRVDVLYDMIYGFKKRLTLEKKDD